MTTHKHLLAAIAAVFLGFAPAHAEPQPVELDPIRHQAAELVVVGPEMTRSYDPADLEALGAHRMVTKTPWRDEEAAFEGVLLTEILERNGLTDVDAIRVVAENEYTVTIPSEIWKRWPILVATRVDGRPHSRRERGPIQFVLPMSEDGSAGQGDMLTHWVWMAARIEVAN